MNEIEEARRILDGGSIVMVGGLIRPVHQEKLRRTLGLREVDWAFTAESTSSHPAIRLQRDTRAVVALLRWIRHYHYSFVMDECARLGVPMVTCTGGYNASRVAHDIVAHFNAAAERRPADTAPTRT